MYCRIVRIYRRCEGKSQIYNLFAMKREPAGWTDTAYLASAFYLPEVRRQIYVETVTLRCATNTLFDGDLSPNRFGNIRIRYAKLSSTRKGAVASVELGGPIYAEYIYHNRISFFVVFPTVKRIFISEEARVLWRVTSGQGPSMNKGRS